MIMKKAIFSLTCLLILAQSAYSFCGFYVAKASASLFNNKSQVILVRDGKLNTITMSNDFQGDVSDFAMVVPVPVILDREDIKVVSRNLFDRLDAYSAPRMVEYYDENPCGYYGYDLEENMMLEPVKELSMVESDMLSMAKRKGVTIEARYEVEEYEVLILSAKESNGLKEWLLENGYQIPAKAEQVLQPYIKNNMKFFVVKVNPEKMTGSTQGYLRPLQISYSHDRFMLPIRLGMANSTGEQDMLVYAFSKKGRLECTNYRTVKVPTDRNIPKFVMDRNQFGKFYQDLYKRAYDYEGKNAVFLEYAWNVSPQWGIKCDPCVADAPQWNDFSEAGVHWIGKNGGNNNVFFTRMHVRYSRDKFPQDLLFQETPNQEQFQARYVIHHPATGDLSCDAGKQYLKDLENRRKMEVDELRALTGWDKKKYQYYIEQYSEEENGSTPIGTTIDTPNTPSGPSAPFQMINWIIMLVGVVLMSYYFSKLTNPKSARSRLTYRSM